MQGVISPSGNGHIGGGGKLRVLVALGRGAQIESTKGLKAAKKLLVIQKQLRGGQDWPLGVMLQKLVAAIGLVKKIINALVYSAMGNDNAIVTKIVKEAGCLLKK